MNPASAVPMFCILALSSIAAVADARRGLIPNWLTLPPLLLAPLVQGLVLGPGALVASLSGLLLCGFVPALLFWRGGMGGGDVKLLAAIGAVVGPLRGMEVQLVAYMVAMVVALCTLAYRGQVLATFTRALRPLRLPGPVQEVSALEIRLGVPVFIAGLSSCVALWVA